MNHDRILMTEYADAARTGQPALIAGFAEIGETIEDTVRREVMEETGIHIKNIQYYKSQPWAFSNTLLIGFFCELDVNRGNHNGLSGVIRCKMGRKRGNSP